MSLKKDSAEKGVYTKTLLKMLKDTFSLVMKVNKTLNQFRKNLVKPSLLQQFVKIVEKVEVIRMALWRFTLETIESLKRKTK